MKPHRVLELTEDAQGEFHGISTLYNIRVKCSRDALDADGAAEWGTSPWKLGMLSASLLLWDVMWGEGVPEWKVTQKHVQRAFKLMQILDAIRDGFRGTDASAARDTLPKAIPWNGEEASGKAAMSQAPCVAEWAKHGSGAPRGRQDLPSGSRGLRGAHGLGQRGLQNGFAGFGHALLALLVRLEEDGVSWRAAFVPMSPAAGVALDTPRRRLGRGGGPQHPRRHTSRGSSRHESRAPHADQSYPKGGRG